MSRPFGQLALIGTGIVLNLVGLQMFYRVYRRDLDRWLDLVAVSRCANDCSGTGPVRVGSSWIVFCTGGTILLWPRSSAAPGGRAGAWWNVREIGELTMGPAVLGAIALGFIAFGFVEILSASYRRINSPVD
jgi:hypothetical protein